VNFLDKFKQSLRPYARLIGQRHGLGQELEHAENERVAHESGNTSAVTCFKAGTYLKLIARSTLEPRSMILRPIAGTRA
jgi:hypothetical protein